MNVTRHILSPRVVQINLRVARRLKEMSNGAVEQDTELLKQQELAMRRLRRNLLQLSVTRCTDRSHKLIMRSAVVTDLLQPPLTALSYSYNVSPCDRNAQPSPLSKVWK